MTLIIGICGGSGSGKTTLARHLQEKFKPLKSSIISQDNYYLPKPKEIKWYDYNYDHPNAFEWKLLKTHLRSLKNEQDIDSPLYDFSTSSRINTIKIESSEIIILEGFLTFTQNIILNELDYKIFIDTSLETQYQRRLARDVKERGCDKNVVDTLWNKFVVPCQREFVTPSKVHADIILESEDINIMGEKIFKHLLKE